MRAEAIHRFTHDGKRFAIDTETCFCFECDEISWDVLDYYPHTPVNAIYHALKGKHDVEELKEVVGELEWLRAARSILPVPKIEDHKALFDVDLGLKKFVLTLPKSESAGGYEVREALAMFFGRTQGQKKLEIELVEQGRMGEATRISELCEFSLRTANLSGKDLTVAVRVKEVEPKNRPKALDGHAIDLRLEFTKAGEASKRISELSKAPNETLARLAKRFAGYPRGVAGRIIVRPGHRDFGAVVQTLDALGFPIIELDIDGAFARNASLDPKTLLDGIAQASLYYAKRLLEHKYFRLDPIASLFWRIYNGTPQHRTDLSGTNMLAVDADGSIYPGADFFGDATMKLGSVQTGDIDEDGLTRFEDVGSRTTPECMKCWARNLCGGGNVAVHHVRSGSYRKPETEWCRFQREWISTTVSAFNTLASQGVNFSRVYNSIDQTERPSLFTMAKAAFRMNIGMRALEEADAERLVRWENWKRVAYFLCSERGVFLGQQHDREMDALHPPGFELEMMLLKKDGTPFGLFKIKRQKQTGIAEGFVFFADEKDYASEAIRKSFAYILKEAGQQESIRRLLVPVSPWETELSHFLEGVGFTNEGIWREALYSKGEYHDLVIHGYAPGASPG